MRLSHSARPFPVVAVVAACSSGARVSGCAVWFIFREYRLKTVARALTVIFSELSQTSNISMKRDMAIQTILPSPKPVQRGGHRLNSAAASLLHQGPAAGMLFAANQVKPVSETCLALAALAAFGAAYKWTRRQSVHADNQTPAPFVMLNEQRNESDESDDLSETIGQALDAAGIGVIIADACDENLSVVYVNDAFARLSGLAIEHIRGRGCRILFGDNLVTRSSAERDRNAPFPDSPVTTIRHESDGQARWFELRTLRVCDSVGKLTHFIGLRVDISERKRAEFELERLASSDPLTGLSNRRALLDRLDLAVVGAAQSNNYGAVMCVDLDKFKDVNDALGHDAGDTLLREISRRFTAVVRPQDMVARLGGDEFIVLLPNLAESHSAATHVARSVADSIRVNLAEPVVLGDREHRITASIGIALFSGNVQPAADLLKQADTAMYRVKEGGRNSACFFEQFMQTSAEIRLALEDSLYDAIRHGEFRLFLQPQMDAKGVMIGAEALIRWQKGEHEMVMPSQFIPVAEDSLSLISSIGDWVLLESCKLLKQLELAGRAFSISANISPRQFKSPDFVESVRRILDATGASAKLIVLEITEGAIIDNLDESIAKMAELSRMGIRFSIDDFGTGYSSLGYLRKMAVAELKIDGSFVRGVPEDSNDVVLIEAILAIARHHHINVVAEGVETSEQFDFLSNHGCQCFQGHFFRRPVPAADLLSEILLEVAEERASAKTTSCFHGPLAVGVDRGRMI